MPFPFPIPLPLALATLPLPLLDDPDAEGMATDLDPEPEPEAEVEPVAVRVAETREVEATAEAGPGPGAAGLGAIGRSFEPPVVVAVPPELVVVVDWGDDLEEVVERGEGPLNGGEGVLLKVEMVADYLMVKLGRKYRDCRVPMCKADVEERKARELSGVDYVVCVRGIC